MRMIAPTRCFLASSLTGLIASTMLVGPTWAGTGRVRTPEQRRLSVSVSDLDLSTDAGRTTARARIDEAAARLCRKVVDSRSIDFHNALRECADEARRSAALQLELAPTRTAAR